MENPAHNNFEPERLDSDEKSIGIKAINELAKRVRTEIKKIVDGPLNNEITHLIKMSKFFPTPDDTLPGENAERDFEGGSTLRLKPIRYIPKPGDREPEEFLDDPDKRRGDGKGGGNGPVGPPPKTRSNSKKADIYAVRVLKMNAQEEKRVIFTPRETMKQALLSINIAGDSFAEQIYITDVLEGDHIGIKDGRIVLNVTEGIRQALTVKLGRPFNGALYLDLLQQDNGSNDQ